MSKIIAVSLCAIGLLAAGCKTDKPQHHHGCHRIGAHRTSRNGVIHHHYAHPDAKVKEKAR